MRLTASIVCLVALAACQTDVQDGPVSVSAPATVPVSATAEPGPKAVSIALGASVIQQACTDQRPDFAGTPAALARLGSFVQNTRTGTYYSRTHDLSVKLFPGRCSVVMAGQFPPNGTQQVRDAVTPPSAVSSARATRVNGKVYMSFLVRGK